ncbi:hypothetical protein P7C70_g448, partial [Phenoliferia sp. Uapishka_3]
MNAATLPAPLHLRLTKSKSISSHGAQRALLSFLTVDAPSVLANSGGAAVARSNLARLAEALKEELDEANAIKGEPEGGKKKRKNSELKKDGEGKRRKVAPHEL